MFLWHGNNEYRASDTTVGGPRDYVIFTDVDDLEGAQGQTPVGPIKCATAEEMQKVQKSSCK